MRGAVNRKFVTAQEEGAGMTAEWVEVGKLDDLPDGRGVLVGWGVKQSPSSAGSEVFAVGDRCSHAEASLSEGEVFDTEVECPATGRRSTFALAPRRPPCHQAGSDLPGEGRG